MAPTSSHEVTGLLCFIKNLRISIQTAAGGPGYRIEFILAVGMAQVGHQTLGRVPGCQTFVAFMGQVPLRISRHEAPRTISLLIHAPNPLSLVFLKKATANEPLIAARERTAITYITPKITGNKILSAVARDWTYGAFLGCRSGLPLLVPSAPSSPGLGSLVARPLSRTACRACRFIPWTLTAPAMTPETYSF